MIPIFIKPIKLLKKLTSILDPGKSNFGRNWKMFPAKEYANSLIYNALIADSPVMIARLGSTELLCAANYLGVKHPKNYRGLISYIKGKTPPFWWEKSIIAQMQNNAGFFPGTTAKIEQFCQLLLEDMPNVDILGSWLKEEFFFKEQLSNSKKVMLEDLEPFFSSSPWTRALKGKKILVVHPFAYTIENQYKNKDKLFENNLLPDFDLSTITAVQSISGEKTGYKDWFAALDHMKREIAAHDFDICILGCGAYGFPLASYVKGMGKKAIHLGGVTQMLFGIKGNRWETFIVYPYANLYNEYWVRPSTQEKPQNASKVEGACYW